MRVLCAQLGQSERGKAGDPVGPSFQNGVYRTGAAKKIERLHLPPFGLYKSCRGDRFGADLSLNLNFGSESESQPDGPKPDANPEAKQLASDNLRKHFRNTGWQLVPRGVKL